MIGGRMGGSEGPSRHDCRTVLHQPHGALVGARRASILREYFIHGDRLGGFWTTSTSMSKAYQKLRGWIKSHPAASRLARQAVRFIPDVPVTRDIPDFGRITFSLRRHRWMLQRGSFSGHQAMLATFRAMIRPGDVVYDIGANIGYYTCFIAKTFPDCSIAAFEPMSDNLKLLRRNVKQGGFTDRVRIFPLALGATEGEELLQIDDMMDGSAALDRITGGEPSEGRRSLGLKPRTERVSIRMLDRLMAEQELPVPAFIKMDVEGAEAMVLQGAAKTLAAASPRLAIALHGAQVAAEVLTILGEMGYVCYGSVHDGERYRRIGPSDAPHLADNNIVCSRCEDEVVRLDFASLAG